MRRVCQLVGTVSICLLACSCLKSAGTSRGGDGLLGTTQVAQASRADYDRVVKGMKRADVDRALSGLGVGQRSSAGEALKDEETGYRRVWDALSVVRYGSRDDYVYVGFDSAGIARAKALWLGSKAEKEWEQQTLSGATFTNGKLTFAD